MTEPTLIEPAALAASLDDPQLLIVDCRFDLADPRWGAQKHLAGHIPGAVHARLETVLSGPVTPQSGRHPLPTPEAFAQTLSGWGVTADTTIVAYDQGHGAGAARLWWLLRATEWPRLRVLDGGYAAWLAGGYPVATQLTSRVATHVSPRPFSGWVTTAAVEQALRGNSAVLVDARAADRYAGQNETIDPIAGHVPGALNHPFLGNLGPDGRFRSASELRALWHGLLGERGASALISMCGSGVTACQNLLSLEIAGLQGGRLYAGSWSEWIRDPARPVATGAAP